MERSVKWIRRSVHVKPVVELRTFDLGKDDNRIEEFLNSKEGEIIKGKLPTCRLWCVVEIAAAVDGNKPVVVKSGSSVVLLKGMAYEYDTECVGKKKSFGIK